MSPREEPRVETADRRQVRLVPLDLESLLPPEHQARQIWAFLEKLDLSGFYARIRAAGSNAGRPATDPKVLLALWLYAISDGVGSAREIVRLTESDDAYRWLRGGVGLNHHTLSDFRSNYPAEVDQLLTDILGTLVHARVVTLHRVAQDGTKVRANAGIATFKKKESLYKSLKRAKQQVRAVEAQAKDAEVKTRRIAAQKRAAEERHQRIEDALRALPLVRSPKAKKRREQKGKKPSEPRASTTDADARVMKMGDGGFRPAYNVQFATDGESGVIVGVGVSTSAADTHQLVPMLDDIEARVGELPKEYLVDAGYPHFDNIEAAAERNIELYMPLTTPGQPRKDGTRLGPYDERPTDSPAVKGHRRRMKSDAGKTVYRDRSRIAERPNAQLKSQMGFTQFPVRGLAKTTAVTLLTVLAFNIGRILSLGFV